MICCFFSYFSSRRDSTDDALDGEEDETNSIASDEEGG